MRGDGKDIYTYYNDTIASSLPLERAIADRLLTPIDYRVYSDRIDPDALALALKSAGKSSSQNLFSPRNDREIVKTVLKESEQISSSQRIIVFCASLDQMDHFSKIFRDCHTISGRDSRAKQVATVEAFNEGKFSILLARDVLNEGIDIPDASTLVFLRNTESPVVFLQQLGRGLRKVEGKDRVLVLDFVNNLDRIDFLYSFYSRLQAEQAANIAKSKNVDAPTNSLSLDQTAMEVISSLIRKKEESGYLFEVGSLVGSFDYKVNSSTLRHLVNIGKLIPDFMFLDEQGRNRLYLERATVIRFMRQVFSPRFIEGLLPESEFARRIGKNIKWVKDKEKHGILQPSWIHRRPNGRIEFYFTEEDVFAYRRSITSLV